MAQLAFLGTGLLGSGMVENLLRLGHQVVVWNRTPAKAHALEPFGATVADTPESAVAAAERVHMTLPDDEVVDVLVARVVPHLRRDAWLIDHSTTAPVGTRARIERCALEGIRFAHAPVFMSPQMCRDAKGLMLLSGSRATFDALEPELAKMTGEVWYLGERPDLAACFKLFGNSMLFVITAGLTDVFAMAAGLGVSPEQAITVFSKFQVANAIGYRGEKMARGDFGAAFEMTMARKDMRLMLEAAAAQPLTVLPAIAQRMDEAIARGHGQDDLGAIAADVVARKR